MEKKFHFISGLPRSGSTLLSALLSQNPRFHARMSGPLGPLVEIMQKSMSANNELAYFLSDNQRERMLRGLFLGYYGPEFEADVLFDTNRGWCASLGTLRGLFPESRMIACVRHMPWVYDSIEQLIRKNRYQNSTIFGYSSGATVYNRVSALSSGDGLVGFSYNAVREAFFTREAASQLMLLQYETLISDPERAMSAVYDFLGEPIFSHDFDNIEYDVQLYNEFDLRAGTPGMHSLRPRIEPFDRPSVLPPDLFRNFENDSFWRNPTLNHFGVSVV